MTPENSEGKIIRIKSGYVLIIALLMLLINPVNSYPQINNLQKPGLKEKVKVLTLNDCIKIALENNHRIKASREDINIAEAQKKQAESGYWPQINANALYSLTNQDPMFILPGFKMNLPPISIMGYTLNMNDIDVPQEDIKLMDKQNVHASINLTYPLYTGGKVQALNREAESGITIARQNYRKSSLEVEYNVKRLYYAVILAQKIYKIGTDALDRLKVTLELTESLYKNGSGKTTKLDYLKNKVIVDQVKTLVDEVKKNITTAKEALKFTMGTNEKFNLPDTAIPFDTLNRNENYLLGQAYNDNPDWSKLNSAVSIYKAKIDEAYSNYLPSVAIIGSFNQNFNSYKYGITNEANSSIWMIGLGAEVPIFNGFRTRNEVDEAEAELKKISEQKSLLHDAIAFQIKDAINKVTSSIEEVKNTLEAKESATENRSLTERAFKQDMAQAKDLIEAQIMESLMDVQYQKALYDHAVANAQLDLLIGKEPNRN